MTVDAKALAGLLVAFFFLLTIFTPLPSGPALTPITYGFGGINENPVVIDIAFTYLSSGQTGVLV